MSYNHDKYNDVLYDKNQVFSDYFSEIRLRIFVADGAAGAVGADDNAATSTATTAGNNVPN